MLRAERCAACGSEYHLLPGPGSSTCGPSCESQHGDAMVARVGPHSSHAASPLSGSPRKFFSPNASAAPTRWWSLTLSRCCRTRSGRCSPPTWPGSACWRAPWSPAAPSSPGWRSTTGETGECQSDEGVDNWMFRIRGLSDGSNQNFLTGRIYFKFMFHIKSTHFWHWALDSDYKCKFKIRWFGWNDSFLQALFHISIKRCFDSK